MELKKTIKYDIKEKGLHIVDGQVINGDGVAIDLIDLLSKAYGDGPFDLSTTTKVEENYDLGAVVD